LGYGAVKFLRSSLSTSFGAIISIVGGRMQPLPFEQMLNPETKRMTTRRVDVDSEAYECARRYMIRLEKSDFDNPEQLARLAQLANLSPAEFRNRFGYLIDY
jgi:hypothetical protein